jgi:hypothetical protein
MADAQISDLLEEDRFFDHGMIRHRFGGGFVRAGKATGKFVVDVILGTARGIERANLAADRKRLKLLCDRRHRA